MRLRNLLPVVLLLGGTYLSAQHGRRGRSAGSSVSPSPLKGITITSHGVLKQLTKKEIMIDTAENQVMTFRRTGKTKFFRDGHDAKPADFDLESGVKVDRWRTTT